MIKRIVVAGSREFDDYDIAARVIEEFISREVKNDSLIFVSGGCRGADLLGERFAKQHGYRIEVYPAQWDKYGRAAGVKRNKLMADISDYIICFWDGKSRGTKSLIEYAKQKNKTFLIEYI